MNQRFRVAYDGRLFSLGNWIECNGMRGEVTDHSVLSTTLLEPDPPDNGYGFTGRKLVMPNSVLLTHPVHSENPARRFVRHRFRITVEQALDAMATVDWLQ